MYFWKNIFTAYYNYSEQNYVNPNPSVQFYDVYQVEDKYKDISPDDNFDRLFYDFDSYNDKSFNDEWVVDSYPYEPKIVYKKNLVHKHHHSNHKKRHHRHYRILKEISSCDGNDIRKHKRQNIYYVIDNKEHQSKQKIIRKPSIHQLIPCENPRRVYQCSFTDSYAQSGYPYTGGFDPYAKHYFLNELRNIRRRDKEVMDHFNKTTEEMMDLENNYVRKAKNVIKANNMAKINNKISEKRSELMKEQARQYADIKADTAANLRLLGMVPGPVAVLAKKRQLTKKVTGALSKIK